MEEFSKIQITKYSKEDYFDFLSLVSDPKVMKYVGGVLSADAASSIFESFSKNPKILAWAIKTLHKNKYLGHVAIIGEESFCELIVYIKSEYWNKKIATNASLKAFSEIELLYDEVIGTVDSDNTASITLCKKLGFKFKKRDKDEEGEYDVFTLILR